jgi:hypothetical protein
MQFATVVATLSNANCYHRVFPASSGPCYRPLAVHLLFFATPRSYCNCYCKGPQQDYEPFRLSEIVGEPEKSGLRFNFQMI